MKKQQAKLARMIAIAATAHQSQFDRGGKPYILHCLTVMHKVKSDDLEIKQIAVAHDLIEDTEWTLAKLHDEGFSSRVLDGLSLLTHAKEVSYDQYIKSISTNMDATLVKMADLRHNSDITRMKNAILTDKDFDRVVKYQKAYAFLEKALFVMRTEG